MTQKLVVESMWGHKRTYTHGTMLEIRGFLELCKDTPHELIQLTHNLYFTKQVI
jgi:hypothetical protein